MTFFHWPENVTEGNASSLNNTFATAHATVCLLYFSEMWQFLADHLWSFSPILVLQRYDSPLKFTCLLFEFLPEDLSKRHF